MHATGSVFQPVSAHSLYHHHHTCGRIAATAATAADLFPSLLRHGLEVLELPQDSQDAPIVGLGLESADASLPRAWVKVENAARADE